MSWTWAVISLAWGVAALGLMLVIAQWLERRSWPAWRRTLSGDAAGYYVELEREIEAHMFGLDRAVWLAGEERIGGRVNEAARVLRIAADLVDEFVPGLVDRLARWSEVARAVMALYPVTPLHAGDFRLWRLSSLATLHAVVHAFLVSSRERFALRLHVLRVGFLIVLRAFRGCAEAARRGRPALDRSLGRVQAVRSDLGTLNRASLTTLHALMVSLRSTYRAEAA